MSDLHLEFHDIELPGGDILLLAGDCFLATVFMESKTDATSRSCRKRMVRFAKKELSKYQKVFYVRGNHDSYGCRLEDTASLLEDFFGEYAPNTVLLDNSSEIYEGVAFAGTPLWAGYGCGKPAGVSISQRMNDFYRIRTAVPVKGSPDIVAYALALGGRTILVSDIAKEHEKAKKYLRKILKFTKEKYLPTIVLTHHAPSYLSQSKRFKYLDDGMDEAYYSNQHKIIESNPQIAMWIHGHTHDNCHYRIGNTAIIANQRGYFPSEQSSRFFDPAAEDFDLEEIKKIHGNMDHVQAGDARANGDDSCEQELSAGTKPSVICGAG